MSLLPCPCGQVPERLNVVGECVQRKYAMVVGDCCGDWIVEFKNSYATDPDVIMAQAIAAWNENPRPSENKCPHCNGCGEVASPPYSQTDPYGDIKLCAFCNGTGKAPVAPVVIIAFPRGEVGWEDKKRLTERGIVWIETAGDPADIKLVTAPTTEAEDKSSYQLMQEGECTYAGGNQFCPTCPVTALHMCKLLQEQSHD